MLTSPPDCLKCGACCVSPFVGDGYIQLDRQDEHRLGRRNLPVFELVADPEDRIVLLGTKVNPAGIRVCVGLEGTIDRRVSCTIYAERPQLCRQFEAGSPECHEARRAIGL